jgi:hypothetical protein
MNYSIRQQAAVRRYMLEDSSQLLTDSERLNATVQEVRHLEAERYGFASIAQMENALLPISHKIREAKHDARLVDIVKEIA